MGPEIVDLALHVGRAVGARDQATHTPFVQATNLLAQGVLLGMGGWLVLRGPAEGGIALGTVLANEEVTNEGRSERGNHPVFKRPLRQWILNV